ncbi:MAG: serine/threonine protein kinase [Anaerolineae bacterium]|nr:serine/threonine protein kinase [Anaerolineae bacterium]
MSAETVLNDRYVLVAQQGSGGMAVIYRATDRLLMRTVAIKILRPSMTSNPEFIDKFQAEARNIANLSHPNIVTVHDVGRYAGPKGETHYMVMEFIEGSDLKRIIRETNQMNADKGLALDLALHFAISICAGIGFAHRAGIVHADVKPQNVLITNDQRMVKVTDFGIARAMSETQPGAREDVVWGSPHYFSPEQAKGEKPSPASDVYSIGIVLFEMLTGHLPFTGGSQQELALAHVKEEPPLVSALTTDVPDQLVRIVRKAMDKNPGARYRDADQLLQLLVSFRDQLRLAGSHSRPIAPPPGISQAGAPQSTMPSQPINRPPDPRPIIPPPGGAQPSMPQYPVQPGRPFSGATPPPMPIRPSMPPQQSGSGVMTQRFNAAPEAPNAPAPMQNTPSVRPQVQRMMQPVSTLTPPPQPPVDPSFYNSRSMRPLPQAIEPRPLFDSVTIALVVIAAIAVVCLIPLFLAALNARAG